MSTNNNPYNNRQVGNDKSQMTNVLHGSTPPQIPLMPPPPPMPRPRRARGQWQQRAMNAIGRMKDISYPKWLTQYSIAVYILALMVVTFMYSEYSLPWYYMLSGVVGILVFFLYGSNAIERTSVIRMHNEKNFEKRIFLIAFVPRLLFMFLLYWIFMENYGNAFGFENQDTTYYDELGQFVAGMIERGDFHFYDEITKWNGGHDDISDMGYGVYVGFVYWLTDNSIIAVRLLKCILSSITVVLVYRLAKRNFGDQTARIAAIFCALWPNFWYYCANHLKETEMVFMVVLFVEQADQMLRSRKFTAWKMVPIILIVSALFTFRTVLALIAILALLFTIVMSSTKVISWGKRIIIGILAILMIGITMGNQIEEQSQQLYERANRENQKENMEWRSNRKDERGNTQSFAKYAGAAVFAPLIFTIPFPTMVRPFEGQEMQQLLNGGYWMKNILSGFVIFALLTLLLSGKWREHMLPLSFMIGYAMVLAFSNFAHSERFHQPNMPFEFMFAAYGLSIAVMKKKYKRWFLYWCGLMFVAAIAWNWFKLAGRGLA